ncbi:MAG: hypothetical protein KC421_24385 [Anaerolineales bacterium]|nr:hypothetical protein [Anaerolineales bacterium]
MNTKLLYICEEHISENASPTDAKRVVDLLRANGWIVSYGDRQWQFAGEDERPLFEKAFQWAVNVVQAEKRPFHLETFVDLARQRVRQNEKLRVYESQLLDKRPEWSGYLGWLIESPTSVILNWLEIVWAKKDASKD